MVEVLLVDEDQVPCVVSLRVCVVGQEGTAELMPVYQVEFLIEVQEDPRLLLFRQLL